MVLHTTQSICPVCHRPLKAYYVLEDGRISFVKTCPQHGVFQTTVSEYAEDYKQWVKHPVINIAPKSALTGGDPADQSCPLHCGTCENHLQTACCVLIDVTDRCNQRCPYCFAKSEKDVLAGQEENAMPAGPLANARRPGEPTLAELERKYDLLMGLGEERPFNIQISGGEPTLRDDLPQIISMARAKGFSYVQINTNGRRLALEENYAEILKEAGASVIFMQFDGTKDEIYEVLRGEPLFAYKKRAIRNCERAGLPVTLVPTVVAGVNMDNIGEMMDFALEHINVVKGIHFQPVSFFGRHPEVAEECSRNRGGAAQFFGDRIIRTGDFPGRVTMFGLLRELEAQRSDFKYEHFCPIATGHTLCCFYSTYIKEPDGSVRCTLTNAQKEAGIGCCDMGGQSLSQAERDEVVRRDRDFVLNKWEVASKDESADLAKYKSSLEITALDDFLRYYRMNSFTVTGMAFQDASNLDAERLKRCRVQVLSDDDKLIPFCAYNSIYRDGKET